MFNHHQKDVLEGRNMKSYLFQNPIKIVLNRSYTPNWRYAPKKFIVKCLENYKKKKKKTEQVVHKRYDIRPTQNFYIHKSNSVVILSAFVHVTTFNLKIS